LADHEDALLATERQKADWARKLDHVTRDLKAEREKAIRLETLSQQSQAEASGLRERLDKFASEAKAKDAEIALLRSRENKTIIEHVHVLEKAKKVTDRELAATKRERDELATLVKSLDQHKARLISDVEDMAKQNDMLRKQVKPSMPQEDVSAQVEAERRAKLQAQTKVQELEKQLGGFSDIQGKLEAAERNNVALKQELASLGRTDQQSKRFSTSPSHTRLLQELQLNNEQLRDQMSEELRRGQFGATDEKRKSLPSRMGKSSKYAILRS
jgi:myosin protein heavy chain